MRASRIFQRLCVFCGSSLGLRAIYGDTAAALGRLTAERGIELVYGGGHVGLMGALADAALAANGHVIGVMPQSLIDREVGHAGLPDMRIVGSMHERKALMAELADGFIALPGAHGTLDEFCEVLTWAQLGIHAKPCGILNVNGYYDGLLALFDHAVDEGFLKAIHRDMIVVESDPAALLDRLEEAPVVTVSKWITPGVQKAMP
ncbi:MAG: TIGR00730 family Rossman fold protein [Bryobacteraceae bacterium]